jgi:hypothetical protein
MRRLDRRSWLQGLAGAGLGVAGAATDGVTITDATTMTNHDSPITTTGCAFDAKIDDNYGPNSAAEYHGVLDGVAPPCEDEAAELVGIEYTLTIYFEEAIEEFIAAAMEWELSLAETPAVIGTRSSHFSTSTVLKNVEDQSKGSEQFDDAEYTVDGDRLDDVIAFDTALAANPMRDPEAGVGAGPAPMRVHDRISFRNEFGAGYRIPADATLYNHLTTSHKYHRAPWHLTVYWRAFWDGV